MSVVFSVTQTAAISGKDMEILGKQMIPAFGDTACIDGPHTVTGMSVLLKQYCTVWL